MQLHKEAITLVEASARVGKLALSDDGAHTGHNYAGVQLNSVTMLPSISRDLDKKENVSLGGDIKLYAGAGVDSLGHHHHFMLTADMVSLMQDKLKVFAYYGDAFSSSPATPVIQRDKKAGAGGECRRAV